MIKHHLNFGLNYCINSIKIDDYRYMFNEAINVSNIEAIKLIHPKIADFDKYNILRNTVWNCDEKKMKLLLDSDFPINNVEDFIRLARECKGSFIELVKKNEKIVSANNKLKYPTSFD